MVPFSSFSSNSYNLLGLCNNYVFNCTGLNVTANINLISIPYGTTFQLQFNNTLGTGMYIITTGSSGATYIYQGEQLGQTTFIIHTGTNNNTYTFTYYASSTNPWALNGDKNPSWTVTSNYTNTIVLSNIDTLFVFSDNDSCNMNVALSTPQNGQQFIIRDIGGHIDVNNLILISYNSCTFNSGGSTASSTFTCNDITKKSYQFVYAGNTYYLL